MVQANEIESIGFKWGKKRGIGGKKKDVQFYESFTYDDVEYELYDSVYVYAECEAEPYIGKLIKIWENSDKTKKIKILWFFRPCEISNFLEDDKTLENELFLASGEGAGLANVNPLETIAGKCNVVCISKDSRNPQPSNEELEMADFIFYRTFDVGRRVILDKIDDKIAAIDIKFLLNRVSIQKSNAVPDSNDNTTANAAVADVAADKNALPDSNVSSASDNEKIAHLTPSLVKQKSSLGEKHASNLGVELGEMAKKARQESMSNDKISSRSKGDPVRGESKAVKVPAIEFQAEKKVKATMDSGRSSDRPSKQAKLDDSLKASDDRKKIVQKLNLDSGGSDVKAVNRTATASEEKSKRKLTKDPHWTENISSKKPKLDEKLTELANGKLLEESPREASNVSKTANQKVEVTRRPEADKSKWFKRPPWEERMQNAHAEGRLVLLQNLDPSYTSAEVEDIVWHAFKENCTAKMIQRTAFSSPHSGQAFVIFKTSEAAKIALTKLDESCLLLSNGRPLVGSIATLRLPGKPSTFFGHIYIDKLRLQMQREMKEAVSTSHCSQPNTIEYDMAMDWRLLQERVDLEWTKLYKQQGQELRKLKANLKSK
ncbi:hypothetical protein P3X46_007311 [Hevea brasiliensis]|uniref:BAH domain-containing protein n=1 Tax=Hevea brasiliensis TaxID=3981 RepID=A0ABQ9MT45_HEVBR|nr:protein ANTI-SILENCING 1 isoform X2 [Hevea brasiliensis]XP_058001755.1 protein ANTI-SILENCING 1 isoform X2 [Hevea brasiliensis]KAJ9183461.1 hypothetical protein P3X46_007311 [Hevea brasiliensis]KAJ9183464.1 hypothetical protein P3X46_007311 [Hevea brasiliensis]